jgi:hypothetical protein
LNGLPLILRLAVLITAISPIFSHFSIASAQVDISVYFRIVSQEMHLLIPLMLTLILPVLLLLGITGRTAALAGLILIGVSQRYIPLTNAQVLMVILLAAIFHLGTGSLSIWRPEDRLISLRAGRRQPHPAASESIAPTPVLINTGGTSLREAS